MVELTIGKRKIDLPFTAHLYDVSVEMFEELANETTYAELLDGVMVVRHPGVPWYYSIYRFLSELMGYFADERELGQVLGPGFRVRLGEGRRLVPDAFLLARDQVPRPLPTEFNAVPKLVLEIFNPWEPDHHLEKKHSAYQIAEVGEIWLVNPDQGEVTICTPAPNRRRSIYDTTTVTSGLVHSTVMPGFWIDVDWLWTDPLPNAMTCLRAILE